MAKILMFEKEPTTTEDRKAVQEIVWDAWDASTAAEARKLAQKALELDSACSDAFNVLAFHEKDPQKRKEYYREAVRTFHERYKEVYFGKNSGHFWGILETRPFMYALKGYGRSFWENGETAQAIETYDYMLELNPNDDQGVRFVLVNWLFITGDLKRVRKLLSRYKDNVAGILFGKLLLSLLDDKYRKRREKIFFEVMTYNPYLAPYLLGAKKLPKTIPDRIVLGSANEAASYLLDEFGKEAWRKYPQALEVLKALIAEEQ
jgi:tetratricopeptide (TPR) repeat protein